MARGKRRTAVERKLSVADAVSEAWGELEELGQEMREAFENTPESLQSGGVGEARGEAADALENLTEPDVPEKLGALEITFSQMPLKKKSSRADRRDQAVNTLDAVVTFLDDEEACEGEEDERNQLRDEIENLKDEAESVEFPGMYG